MKRFLKITGIVVAALFVIGIFGAIVNPEGDTTASSDEGSSASEAVGEESEPTVESEPVAEPEPEPEPEETKEPEPSTESEPEPEPDPEPEPAPAEWEPEANESAFLRHIDMFRTSDDYPWMDEDSLTFEPGPTGDEWLVLMGYDAVERVEAMDQPISLDAHEADVQAFADQEGISMPEAVAIYLATESLAPEAYEKLPES